MACFTRKGKVAWEPGRPEKDKQPGKVRMAYVFRWNNCPLPFFCGDEMADGPRMNALACPEAWEDLLEGKVSRECGSQWVEALDLMSAEVYQERYGPK